MVTDQRLSGYGVKGLFLGERGSGGILINRLMAPGVACVKRAAFAVSVAVILAFTAPAFAQDQKKVNDEANAFKLADVTDTSTVDSEVGDGTHATGALPMTAEDAAEMRKHAQVVKKVLLNKIGLARINEERAKKQLKPLTAGRDLDVAPVGQDVELSGPEIGAMEVGGVDAAAAAAASAPGLPTAVDNSKLKYFPPIRNQGSLGSCAQWAGAYYNLTHELALARDWNAKSGGDYYRITPMFSYNFVNGGQNQGSHSWWAWDIARVHGIPRWSEFYTTSYKTWCTNPAYYRSALVDRVAGYSTIYNVNTASGMDTLKAHLANGHTAVYYTYINSWVYKTTLDDPGTTADDAYVGKPIAYKISGNNGGHAMTVVGYNDDIWCDINGNGVVDANEKGAFRIANSWGTGWKESGYCWVAYQALITPNSSVDWDGNKYGIFQYNQIWFVNPLSAPHVPKVVAKVTINHNLRNQVYVKVGTGSVGATSPSSTVTPQILTNQGGAYAFSGAAAASQDFTYYLDFTDIAPSLGTAKRWFVQGTDSGTGNGDLTIKSFELYYNNAGTDQIVGVAANAPKVANGNTQYVWIDWTMGDTSQPTVQWATASQASANESGTMTVTAQLSAALTNSVTVPFTVTGTASSADRSVSASPITIPAGATTGTATVTITPDTLDEPNETVILTMGTPTNALPGATRVHTATITDDDAAPTVNWTLASQASTNESGTMTVTAKLSAVSGQTVTVPFTVTGTATSGTDYTITASPITIAAGALSASATITIKGDTVYEGNETVILTMGTVTNATKGTTKVHTATITEDDANPNTAPFIESSPWANPNPVTRPETTMLSVMALDDGLPNPPAALTYTWSTLNGPGTVTYGANNGTATGDNCVAGFSAAGTYLIQVVVSDSQLTASGQVSVTVFDPPNTPPVANAQSVTTLLGTAKAITLTGSDADGDTLTYAIVTPPSHGTLSGTAPSVTYTPAAGYVGSDSFTFSVTDPSGATGSATVSITVTPPVVSASLVDAEASEPNAAANKGTAKFRFTRTGSLAASLTVKYTLSGTATNGTDYTTLSGTATIAAGKASVDVTVTALTDALDEPNETAIATIAPNAAYVVSTTAPSATVTIYDAEYGPPTVSASASDNAASEPNGAAAKGTGKFRFTRTGSLNASLVVKYTLSGTATNGSDYTTLSGSATIAANATSVDVTVTVLTDALDEPDETAIATITPNAAYVVSTTAPSATVTIYDAEYGPPTVSASASDNAASEPNGAAAKGTGKFRFTRTGSLAASLTVKYTLSGTATNGSDYTALSGSATIAANATYVDVTVTALTDALDEPNETAIATITPNAAYVVSATAPSATVTIYDAEYGPPTVSASASDNTASEPGAATNKGTGKFRFTRTGSLAASLTVKYTLSGTATNGVDYTSLSGTATIAANATYVDVTVTALADSLVESNETAVATIAPDAAYVVSSTAPSATVTIVSAQ